MKNKHDQGFSLVEILVAIVILAAFVVPTCSALVLTAKMNEKTDDMMKAQLAVSSAVETLMAEGISKSSLVEIASTTVNNPQNPNDELYTYKTYELQDARFSSLAITVTEVYDEVIEDYALMPWYDVKIDCGIESINLEMPIRAVFSGGSQ